MRIAKWLMWTILGLLALAVTAAFVVTQLVNPESFKPRLIEMVRESTGQELQLNGPLQLAWFPWLALQSDEGSLGAGSGAAPLLSWRSARLGARLLPLLRGQLQLDQLRLDAPVIALRVDAQGHGNWAPLLARFGAGTGGGATKFGELAGVALRDGTLSYESAAGTSLRLTRWQLDTGPVRSGQAIHFETRLDATLAPGSAAQSLSANGELQLEQQPGQPSGQQAFVLRDLVANAVLRAAPLAEAGLPVTLRAPLLRATNAGRRWTAAAATLQAAGAVVQTQNLLVEWPQGAVLAQLDFDAPVFAPRPLLQAAGVVVPNMRDVSALGSLAARGRVVVDAASARVALASVQLDSTQLAGSLTYARPSGTVEFSLRGDRMDLDRYRAPEKEPSKPFVFPTAALAALQARGVLQLERATVAGLDMRGVRLQLLYRDGQLGTPSPASR